MTIDQIIEGRILTPEGFISGRILLSAGRIQLIEGDLVATSRVLQEPGAILLPGFIDTHVHGGAGFDIMQGADAASQIARCHAQRQYQSR